MSFISWVSVEWDLNLPGRKTDTMAPVYLRISRAVPLLVRVIRKEISSTKPELNLTLVGLYSHEDLVVRLSTGSRVTPLWEKMSFSRMVFNLKIARQHEKIVHV